MILRELVVSNYRAFRDERFQFSERVTVIAGVNGRGKSSILDGLALLLSRLLPQVTPANGGYKYLRPQDIHYGESALTLSLAATFENIPIDFSIDYDLQRGQRPTKLLPQVKREIRYIYGNPHRMGDAAPIAVFYTTDRAAYRLPKRLLRGLSDTQAAAYHGALSNRQVDFRDFMSRYLTWRDGLQRGEDRLGVRRQTLDAIDRAIRVFLPEFENVEVLIEPTLRLVVSKRGQQLDLTQLSDGERSLLAMMIDLCRRLSLANPELDDPLQGTGVVLIDEVELHLHPQWQREVVEKLRLTFPRIQFILTTHSPFLIQSLREGELIRLDREDGDFAAYSDRSIEDITENVMGVPTPQKSQRYLDMVDAAEEYYRLLREGAPSNALQLAALKSRLDELTEPFSDDPAFQALLRVERIAALGGVD
jgi:predicted ATP-binding protein involved in virulence